MKKFSDGLLSKLSFIHLVFRRLIQSVANYEAQHPYLTIILVILMGSLLGIGLEYLLHRDFVSSGIVTTIFNLCLLLLITYFKQKSKKKK